MAWLKHLQLVDHKRKQVSQEGPHLEQDCKQNESSLQDASFDKEKLDTQISSTNIITVNY